MDRIERLVTLFHRRWAVPMLAELHRAEAATGVGGAKFVTFVNRLGASPVAVRQTLDTLIELGWVAPNPGYGHPLRPEYVLTRRGDRLAPGCAALDAALSAAELRGVALKKWSMPVLYAVGEGASRFSEIPRALTEITDRALSLALKDLLGATLVSRDVLAEAFPPVSLYRPGERAEPLLPILDTL